MNAAMSREKAERNADGYETILEREDVLHKRRKYWEARRIQDILLSVLALVVLWPVMLAVSAAIVLESPGASPIFVQNRVGRDGKIFRFYKFRSMCPDAESKLKDLLSKNEMDGPAFKMRDDPRVTKVGRFLRRTSIDELPQLVNILKGDMSIVGPRPPLPREVAQYSDYHHQRLLVTPGLTCYWQIRPDRNSMSFDEWVALDIDYITDSGFWKDWQIIWKTFGAVWSMNGV